MNCWQLIYINQYGPLGRYVKVSCSLDVRICFSGFYTSDEAVDLYLLNVTFSILSDAFVFSSWFLNYTVKCLFMNSKVQRSYLLHIPLVTFQNKPVSGGSTLFLGNTLRNKTVFKYYFLSSTNIYWVPALCQAVCLMLKNQTDKLLIFRDYWEKDSLCGNKH